MLPLLLALLTTPTLRAQETTFCEAQGGQATPIDMLGPFYLPNSPITRTIGPAAILNEPSKRLTVHGRVLSSISGCTSAGQFLGVPNVTVELWYAGEPDALGNYYQPEDFRGKFVTNECGEYAYTQTFPALYPTRPILHNHIRLSHQNNQELVVTQMYFLGTNATEGYLTSTAGRQLQAVELSVDKLSGERFAEFDFYVNVPGNPACVHNNLATTYSAGASASSPHVHSDWFSAVSSILLLAGVLLL